MVNSHFGDSSYREIELRETFAILEDVAKSNTQYLHPYGTSVAYYVDRDEEEKVLS